MYYFLLAFLFFPSLFVVQTCPLSLSLSVLLSALFSALLSSLCRQQDTGKKQRALIVSFRGRDTQSSLIVLSVYDGV